MAFSMPHSVATLKFCANILSAALGIAGTWLMSRRYARNLLVSVVYALTWPVVLLFGGSKKFRDSYNAEIRANYDVQDQPIDSAFGFNLLFWAFVLQLVAVLIEARYA